jgi:hypothetical protein
MHGLRRWKSETYSNGGVGELGGEEVFKTEN